MSKVSPRNFIEFLYSTGVLFKVIIGLKLVFFFLEKCTQTVLCEEKVRPFDSAHFCILFIVFGRISAVINRSFDLKEIFISSANNLRDTGAVATSTRSSIRIENRVVLRIEP